MENKDPMQPTGDDIVVVRSNYLALCANFGHVATDPLVMDGWDRIVDAYMSGRRHYHNLAHIAHMLRAFEKIDLPPAVMMQMRAFAIYHDIVYETRDIETYRQNEAHSADSAGLFLRKLGADDEFVQIVDRWIRATKDHLLDPVTDPYGCFALDVDMSILGSEARIYRAYKAAIRKEFAHIPDPVFYAARRDAFLVPTITRGRIYMTDEMHDRLHDRAMNNLRAELLFLPLKPAAALRA